MNEIRVLSLFSGIGGFDLGLERASNEHVTFRTVAFVEQDEYCQKVLRARWPGVPVFGDVRTVSAATLPACDLICGGFPCQDISVAGRGEGIRGARSGLWSEFARLIREIEPRWVLVENVSALLGRGLSVVLADLSACGLDAEWDCLPASSVGAPHQRDRVWLAAYPRGERVRLFAERDQRQGRGERAAERGDAVVVDDGAPGDVAGRDPDGDAVAADADGCGRGSVDGVLPEGQRDLAGGGADVADAERERRERGTERDGCGGAGAGGRRGGHPDAGAPERSEGGTVAGDGGDGGRPSDVADAARDGAGGATPAGPERQRARKGRERGREGAYTDAHGRRRREQRLAQPEPGLEGARGDELDGLCAAGPADMGDAEGDGRGPGGTRRPDPAGAGERLAEWPLPGCGGCREAVDHWLDRAWPRCPDDRGGLDAWIVDFLSQHACGDVPDAEGQRSQAGCGGTLQGGAVAGRSSIEPERCDQAVADAERAGSQGHGGDTGQPALPESGDSRPPGRAGDMAHARSGEERPGLRSSRARRRRRGQPGDCGGQAGVVAHADEERLAGGRLGPRAADGGRPHPAAQGAGVGAERRRQPEPHMGGGVDGVSAWLDGSWERGIARTVRGRQPNRVPRLRALGNALVPQISQWLGMRIAEREREQCGD